MFYVDLSQIYYNPPLLSCFETDSEQCTAGVVAVAYSKYLGQMAQLLLLLINSSELDYLLTINWTRFQRFQKPDLKFFWNYFFLKANWSYFRFNISQETFFLIIVFTFFPHSQIYSLSLFMNLKTPSEHSKRSHCFIIVRSCSWVVKWRC